MFKPKAKKGIAFVIRHLLSFLLITETVATPTPTLSGWFPQYSCSAYISPLDGTKAGPSRLGRHSFLLPLSSSVTLDNSQAYGADRAADSKINI